MHTALYTTELLELIFSHICEKKFLNALARTCRAFLRPALALLWERIVTLEAFILLLPESKRFRDSETRITTIDDLTPSDVSRARLYAPFVRDLDLRNSHSSFEVDGPSVARVARALCASSSCSPLTGDKAADPRQHAPFIFPNLRTFSLVAGYADSLPALLAPSVTDLELILHHRSMDVEELYRTVGILLGGGGPSRGDGRALGERDGVLAGRGVPDGLTVRSRRGCFPPSVKTLHVVLDYPDNQSHLFRELLARRGDGTRSLCGDSTSSPLTDSISSHPKDDIPTLPGDTIPSRLDDTISSRLGDTIRSLVIDFSHLDARTLQAIATMPSLEHLEVYGRYREHSFELDDVLDISPATKNIAPHQKKTAPRLRSLAVDILTPGVLTPYISGAVLRVLRPPALTHLAMERALTHLAMERALTHLAMERALTHLTMERPLTHLTLERILSPAHLRQACADIACSSAARTLAYLTLTGDWTGTSVSPRDLRALHVCRGLEELELVWLEIRFGVGGVRRMGEVQRMGEAQRMGEEGSIRLAAQNMYTSLEEENMDTSLEEAVMDTSLAAQDMYTSLEEENMDTSLEEENMDTSPEEEEIREMGAAWPRLRRFAVREVGRGEGEGRARELHASEGGGDADTAGVGDADTAGVGGADAVGGGDADAAGARNSGPRRARLAAFARYFPNLEELEI